MEEQQTLSVRQFHYLAWPDHGVPYSPDPLLAFQNVLRQWLDQTMDGGLPIVHCRLVPPRSPAVGELCLCSRGLGTCHGHAHIHIIKNKIKNLKSAFGLDMVSCLQSKHGRERQVDIYGV